jgi:hypothetical protein
MLQNQETFAAIAAKVGSAVPALSAPTGADQAEKNHSILLQNRSIVVGILKKLSIPPAPPAELKGTFSVYGTENLFDSRCLLHGISASLKPALCNYLSDSSSSIALTQLSLVE